MGRMPRIVSRQVHLRAEGPQLQVMLATVPSRALLQVVAAEVERHRRSPIRGTLGPCAASARDSLVLFEFPEFSAAALRLDLVVEALRARGERLPTGVFARIIARTLAILDRRPDPDAPVIVDVSTVWLGPGGRVVLLQPDAVVASELLAPRRLADQDARAAPFALARALLPNTDDGASVSDALMAAERWSVESSSTEPLRALADRLAGAVSTAWFDGLDDRLGSSVPTGPTALAPPARPSPGLPVAAPRAPADRPSPTAAPARWEGWPTPGHGLGWLLFAGGLVVFAAMGGYMLSSRPSMVVDSAGSSVSTEPSPPTPSSRPVNDGSRRPSPPGPPRPPKAEPERTVRPAQGDQRADAPERRRLPLLTVISNPSGARVFVDGRPLGRTPLVRQHRWEGRRRLEIRRRGYATYVAELEPDERSGTITVQADLEPIRRR